MDEWVRAAVLGVVQATTEFLPVSSSGHLVIGRRFLGDTASPVAFDVGLHVGTLVAVLLWFRHDWMRLVAAYLRLASRRPAPALRDDVEVRLGALLALGTVPTVLVGWRAGGLIEAEFRGPVSVAVMLILGGVALWVVDAWAERSPQRLLSAAGALTIGLWQILALIPGMSRSGATLIGGRSVGLSRTEAARFSFLLAAPVIMGAALLEIPSAVATDAVDVGPLLLGMLVSFLVGLAVIRFFLAYVATRGFAVFAAYRGLVGLGVLIAVIAGWM